VKFATLVWPAAVVLCSALVCSAPAFAQSEGIIPPSGTTLTPPSVASIAGPKHDDIQIRIAAAVWASGVLADQITTYQFSSQYRDQLHETNPLIRGLDGHPTLLVAAGSAMDAATGWAAFHFLAPKHPRIAKVAFYGFAAYRIYLAAYNVQMMRRADTMRTSTPLSVTAAR
jgi:hypothetical protein